MTLIQLITVDSRSTCDMNPAYNVDSRSTSRDMNPAYNCGF